MRLRFWFYLGSLIVIIGLGAWLLGSTNRLRNEQARLEAVFLAEQNQQLDEYLARQKDDRKLISLAKLLAKAEPALVKPIIERAYALNPNSRDIAILASRYHPELKERLEFLDPLYSP